MNYRIDLCLTVLISNPMAKVKFIIFLLLFAVEISDGKNTAFCEKTIPEPEAISLGGNWSYISDNTGERDNNIESIFHFIYTRYERIFGIEVMNFRSCTIYNDKNAPNPKTIPNYDNNTIRIRLALSDTRYWTQLAYQLSHEIMHCVYYSTCWNQSYSKWNEEIICEAMSLYMLNQLAQNWDSCSLSGISKVYQTSVLSSLNSAYGKATLPLKSTQPPITMQEFQELSLHANTDRNDHKAERNYLYDCFLNAKIEELRELINMYKYYSNKKYVDYPQWIKKSAYPEFVRKLSAIQPNIILK